MIDTKELRLGNWLSVGESNIQSTVSYVAFDSVHLMGNGIINRPDQLFGIPLTPEILKACGFEKMIRPDDFIYKGLRITHVHLTGNFCYALGNGNNPPAMKYLHQLQNLIYAITGEEINYTP